MNRISPKRKASTQLRYNSPIAVKPRPKVVKMTIEQLKASGLLTKASKVGKSDRARWKAKADKWFSEFIRLRDSDEHGIATCITSGRRMFWRKMDAGHYITRAREATRYDERNAHAQSKRANQYQGGHFIEHEQAIERIHGPGTAQKLRDLAGQDCKRSAQDYQALAEHYQAEVFAIRDREPGRYFAKGG